MSIHSITISQFMLLDRKQLELAIRLCTQEIAALQLTDREAPDYAQVQDEINSALTLRNVHQARLDELLQEEPTAAAADAKAEEVPASVKYGQRSLLAA